VSGLGRRTLIVLFGMAVVATTIAVPGAIKPATADTGCSTTTGVTVIVDFKALGGGLQRGCAINPASGLDALHKAGFGTAGTTRWGNAFVCRIDGKPGNPPESCAETPPGTAYWAYYTARPTDASWKYVSLAATLTRPQPGSIEGWAFGARALPGVAPGDAIAPPVTVPPSTQPPVTNPPPTNPPVTVKPGGGSGNSTPATLPAQGGGDNGSGGPSGGTPPVTTADGKVVAPPITRPDGSPAPTAALTPEQKAKVKADKAKAKSNAKTKANADAAKVSDAETDETQSGDAVVERTALGAPVNGSGESGSPLPAVLAVLLIAALAGGSFFVIRKRRLQSS
jgi:hypothetical protein